MGQAPPSRPPAYESDIHGQPEALRALLDAGLDAEVEGIAARLARFPRVVMTGMGASLFALHPTYLALAAAGVPVWAVETSELLGAGVGLIGPGALLWIVSQSGASAEVVALLDGLPSPAPVVVGVTSDTASPLAARADVVLELHSGEEQTVGTRSYLNTLAAHALVTATVRAEDAQLDTAPDALQDYLDGFEAEVTALGERVRGPASFVIGRGASLAAVRTGALIIKEAAKVPFEGMSAAQFRHGPLELVGPEVDVLVLAGGGDDRALNVRTFDDVRALGGRATLLAPGDGSPDLHGAAAPLGEILPLQALSVALARRHGREPGAFRHIAKVTRTL